MEIKTFQYDERVFTIQEPSPLPVSIIRDVFKTSLFTFYLSWINLLEK